jgi:hypothetical protein
MLQISSRVIVLFLCCDPLLQDTVSGLTLRTSSAASLGSTPDGPGESAFKADRSANGRGTVRFRLYALVSLGGILEGRQDVWVGTTLDAVDEVGYLAEEG